VVNFLRRPLEGEGQNMGKYSSVVVGVIVTLLGFVGIIGWWGDFVSVLKGFIPLFLIFGGLIASMAGLSETKDRQTSKKEEAK